MIQQRKNFSFKFVIFCKETRSGDNLYVSGSTAELGKWDINKAIKLSTNQAKFPSWESPEIPFIFDNSNPNLNEENYSQTSSSVSSRANDSIIFEYKFFIKSKITNKIQWEYFSGNRIFTKDMIQNIFEKVGNEESVHEYFLINGELFNNRNMTPKIIKILDLTTESYKEADNKTTKSNISKEKPKEIKQQKSKSQGVPKKQLDTNALFLKDVPTSKFIPKSSSNEQPEVKTKPEASDEKLQIEENTSKDTSFSEENLEIDNYLNDLEKVIQDIKNDKGKLKSNLQLLFNSFKDKKNIDKELILLIFIHFVKSGQLKFPDRLSSYIEHRHHHDPTLARTMYTYLLANINYDNSLLIRSILSYVPTCLDYRVKEFFGEKIKKPS